MSTLMGGFCCCGMPLTFIIVFVGLGLLPGIFYPILGFGKAKYLGPQTPPAA